MTDTFIEGCGLLATFIGTLLEGEISMLTSVIGAKAGYYNFYLAMLAGFAGASVADWFKFIIGKTKGQQLLKNKPELEKKINKLTSWFDKYPIFVLTFYKLFFGVTTVIILIAGIKGISYAKFAFFSTISIILWVALLSSIGYFFAEEMIMKIEYLSEHKLKIIIILFSIAFLYWFFYKRPMQKAYLDC